MGGGRLAATQAVNGLANEVSGPLAYGLSLIAIVGTATSWYRHHHDMGALAQGGMGALFVGGVALGATSLMGMIPLVWQGLDLRTNLYGIPSHRSLCRRG